jgi:hypothetical protein
MLQHLFNVANMRGADSKGNKSWREKAVWNKSDDTGTQKQGLNWNADIKN